MPETTHKDESFPAAERHFLGGRAGVGVGIVLVTMLAGCAGSNALPQTRSLVTVTGERVQADPEAMVEVDRWLRPQLDQMSRDDSYTIRILQEDRATYPWDGLELMGDTAQVTVQQGQGDAETPYRVYAHFRLMAERGELERWLPEAAEAEGFPLERAILVRTADLWLFGRAVFDTTPYGPLDEILFAHQSGFLDEFIFATQGERFEQERVAYYENQPEREAAFRRWFLQTFESEGPRFLLAEEAVATGS
jgi:hypothetical protein